MLEKNRQIFETEQKARMVHNYKYSVFMMMRRGLLKKIKEEKMDEKYTQLK